MDWHSLIGVLVSWLPMLLLIAVWIFFMTRLKPAQNRAMKDQQDHMDQLRKQNTLLERIAKALEERRST